MQAKTCSTRARTRLWLRLCSLFHAHSLEQVDIDAAVMPAGLDDLHATRDAQRARPGFGALADGSVMYLRRRWDGEDDVDPAIYLMEIGPDGRRMRQVELPADGTAIKSGSNRTGTRHVRNPTTCSRS